MPKTSLSSLPPDYKDLFGKITLPKLEPPREPDVHDDVCVYMRITRETAAQYMEFFQQIKARGGTVHIAY